MSKVLIVDDLEANLYLLEVLLQGHGYQVQSAANGAEALELARAEAPDLIVSDILMPVMDGFALCRQWKQDDVLKNVPFIFYTATYTEPKDEEFALSLGAERFLIKPAEPEVFVQIINEVITDHQEGNLEKREPEIDHEELFLQEYNVTLVNKLEQTIAKLKSANDALRVEVEERKRAEDSLRESESRHRMFLERLPESIIGYDMDGKVLFVNHAFEKKFGWSSQELLNKKIEFVPEEARLETLEKVAAMLCGDEVTGFQTKRLTKDGQLLDIKINAAPFHDQQGQQIGNIIILRDLTEIERSREALKKREAHLSSVLRSSPTGIGVVVDLVLTEVNPQLCAMTGYSEEELLGQPARIFYPSQQEYKWSGKENYRQIKARGTGTVETRWQRKDGAVRDILLSSTPIISGDLSAGVTFTALDFTERKVAEKEKAALQERLQQAQKMEAIGTLAGGIAHDFNNILTAILGYSELLQMSLPAGDNNQGKVEEILKAGMRARDLVQRILTFSRKTEQELKPIQVDIIVDEAMQLLRASMPSDIEMQMEIETKSLIKGDSTQIHQVVMNLCTNAGHAMRVDGGMLKVELRDVEVDPTTAAKLLDMKPGAYVNLIISDTGCGMESDILERIFDPFFTTKERGEGTGLGLSMVHGIITGLGGMLYAYSEPEEGTSFKVYLPLLQTDGETKTMDTDLSVYGGTETIMVVDDEPAIAQVAGQMLTMLGYKVEVKTDSQEALALFKQQPHRFDLVVADMTMPGMTGDKLVENMLEIRPELPIIIATGFSARISDHKARELGVRTLIPKPFDMNQLAKATRQALDSDLVN